MDSSIWNSVIVGVTAVTVAVITHLFNLWQNRSISQYRLTESAFNARIQAYGDLATAMQSVDFAVKQIGYEVNNKARDWDNRLPDGQLAFQPGLADIPVPLDMYTQLAKAAQTYLDTYYRTRMYLTPEMEEIANQYAAVYVTGVQLVPVADQFTYEWAAEWIQVTLPHGRYYVEELTAEMRKYLSTVEKGR